MKRTHTKSTEPAVQSVFHKVAENLYRLESSGGYYALVKRAGKQFRRSLKTKDRKLAERRLSDLKAKVGALRISDDADLNFRQVANYWNEATKHTIAGGTLARRNTCIKNLLEFFKDASSVIWKFVLAEHVASWDCHVSPIMISGIILRLLVLRKVLMFPRCLAGLVIATGEHSRCSVMVTMTWPSHHGRLVLLYDVS